MQRRIVGDSTRSVRFVFDLLVVFGNHPT